MRQAWTYFWQRYRFDRFFGWSRWQAFWRAFRPAKELPVFPPTFKAPKD